MPLPSTRDKLQSHIGSLPSRFKLVAPILFACLVILAAIYSPWIMFISFAMLPSFLIRLIDKSEKRVMSFSVTGLNITGLLLTLQRSYRIYGPFPEPGALLKDWTNWALPFGFAWMGVMFFFVFPIVFTSVMEIRFQHKERRLKEQQETLLKTWGTQVRQGLVERSKTDDKQG